MQTKGNLGKGNTFKCHKCGHIATSKTLIGKIIGLRPRERFWTPSTKFYKNI